ncbi:MAG: hypothetical protein ABI615_11035 [Chthoniobacterales bacterium]
MNKQNGITMDWKSGAGVLDVLFCGKIDLLMVQRHLADVASLNGEISNGFTLLTDLSGLTQMDSACIPILGKIMDCFRKYGVGQIIRIIPHPTQDIGFNILSVFHYGNAIPVVTCASRKEADALLS